MKIVLISLDFMSCQVRVGNSDHRSGICDEAGQGSGQSIHCRDEQTRQVSAWVLNIECWGVAPKSESIPHSLPSCLDEMVQTDSEVYTI